MEEYTYVPPRFLVFEAAFAGEDDPRREFAHFDGRVGEPAASVVLLATSRSGGTKIAIESSARGGPPGEWDRVAAVARCRDLAGMGLPDGGWDELEQACKRPEAWSPRALMVDERPWNGEAFRILHDLWLTMAWSGENAVTAYVRGAFEEGLEARSVTDWSAYGVDLGAVCKIRDLPIPRVEDGGGLL